MDKKKDILWRVGLMYVGIIVFALFIIGRIFQLQYIQGDKWREKKGDLAMKNIVIEPSRGNIISEDGKLLAISVPFYLAAMDMMADGLKKQVFNENVDSLALCLSQLFEDKSKNDYKKELIQAYQNGNRYYVIKNKLNYVQLKKMKTFPIFRLGQYKGGFIVIQEDKRIRPFGSLAARTLGNFSKTRTVVGLEGAYDIELRGVQGIKLMQKLSGDVWMPVRDGNEVEPQDGNDIVTTIDVGLQDVAETALRNQLSKNEAGYGCAILMEVKTGEIKAITNLTRKEDGTYSEELNYAVGSGTEPGSTFKLASLIVAMEDGYITSLDEKVNTGNGIASYYGHKMKDSHEGGYGTITIQQVFELSSNVGISKIIWDNYKNQPNKFINRLYKMRLNQKLGIEIKGEGIPKIKDPSDSSWSGITLPWMSIGYEVQLTPLQVLSFYNAVANNGVMVKPRFVKEIRHRGEVVKTFETEILNPSICSNSTLEKVHKMLLGVVENGTARNLKNPNYKIAGKTGTAQVAQKNAGYSNTEGQKAYQASFVGYFPAENPQYSCMVVINSPSKSVYYGNIVSGPVFKEIADKVYATRIEMLPNLVEEKVKPVPSALHGYKEDFDKICSALKIKNKYSGNSDWVVTSRDTMQLFMQTRNIVENQVPNIVGMGLRDAVYLIENLGLRVRIEGEKKGKVKRQFPQPGCSVNVINEVIIELG